MRDGHYLDHNATAPLRAGAIAAVQDALGITGNGSSVHGFGRTARKTIEQARAHVAALCGALPEMVTFTSGGTEANNMVLRGVGKDRIIISAVEHSSVRESCPDAVTVPVDRNGVVDLGVLKQVLTEESVPTLVSIMYANNETGVVQPVSRVAALCRDHDAVFHCDAVQAAGKVALDVETFGADLLTLSAHKIGGPAGVGALINVTDVAVTARTFGGGQEKKQRSGTENLIGIAGFGGAARETQERGAADIANARHLRDRLEHDLARQMPLVRVVGANTERLANTSCIIVPGVDSETLVMNMDLQGVAISAGSACSSGTVKISRVLQEMGYSDDDTRSAIRISLGWSSTNADVDAFIAALFSIYDRAKQTKAA